MSRRQGAFDGATENRPLGITLSVLPALVPLALVVTYYVFRGSAFSLFVLNTVLLASLGAVALNLLMGGAGQVSIGNSAFLAVGAFSSVFFLRAGVPFPLDVPLAAIAAGAAGVVVGLPALRISGLYLVLATLAAHFIVLHVVDRYQSESVGAAGFLVPRLFGSTGHTNAHRWWALTLFLTLAATVVVVRCLLSGRAGRAWQMVRYHELVAPALGVNVRRLKLQAFAISSTIIGLQGALTVHFSGVVLSDRFTLALAISYIAMIIIGGINTTSGPILGAVVVVSLPSVLPSILENLDPDGSYAAQAPRIAHMLYGALIILFVTMSPGGMVGWLRDFWSGLKKRFPHIVNWRTHSSASADLADVGHT